MRSRSRFLNTARRYRLLVYLPRHSIAQLLNASQVGSKLSGREVCYSLSQQMAFIYASDFRKSSLRSLMHSPLIGDLRSVCLSITCLILALFF